MSVIVYTKMGSVTARFLAKELAIEKVNMSRPGKIGEADDRQDFLINWGVGLDLTEHWDADRTLNNCEAVQEANQKFAVWDVWEEVGLTTPRNAVEEGALESRVLWRLPHHHGGMDILIQEPGEEPPEGWQTRAPVTWVPNDAEYRVHVFQGETLAAQKKVPKEGEDAHPYIHNHTHGWKFVRMEVRNPDARLYQVARTAVESIGLDFGAADILHTLDGEYCVLEVNTAPSLSEVTLPLYVARIKQWMEG